jgi:hypothetical protein
MTGRILPPLALLGVVSLTLAAGFSQSQVFFYRDLTVFFYPVPELAWRMIRAGELPLWNPYSAFGTPLAAMADVLLFYPGTWLRFLLPFPFGFNFNIIAHYYVAVLATYALCRKLEMSRIAACAAALAFALSGPLLSLGTMLNVLVGACWMPAVLLAARYAVEKPSTLRILALGGALGMQAIGGEPLFGMAAAILALPLCGVTWTRLLRALIPASLFGMALIAVQLIPGLELLRDSVRESEYFTFAESSFWSLHPLNLLDSVVPGVMFEQGSGPYRRFLFGGMTPYLMSLYLGLLPLGLAAWALLQSPKKQVSWVAAVCWGSLAFALGHHAAFFSWFYSWAPFVKSSRYPSKTMVVIALAVALLAGWGLDALRERRPFRWGWSKWAGAFAAGFLLQAVLAGPVTSWAAQRTWELFGGPLAAAHAGRLAALALLLGLAVWLGPKRPGAVAAIVLAAMGADLALTGRWVNPTAPAELLTTRPPLVEAIGSGSGEFRVQGDFFPAKLSLPIRDGWSTEAVEALQSRLAFSYGAALYGVRDGRDLSPNRLYTPEYYRFGLEVMAWKARGELRRLGEYNIRYFVTPAGPPPPAGLRQVALVPTLTDPMAVWEIEGWRPRAEIPGGTARIVAESPTRVSLQVESADGGRLLLRDRYHRGWKAWVDGVPAEIQKQGMFRTVQVPPGGRLVGFAYRPWTFFAGAAISLAAVLFWIVAAVKPKAR